MRYSCRRPAPSFARFSTWGWSTRYARPATRAASTRSGIIRPVLGKRTTASGSTTCFCRRKQPTASQPPASTNMLEAGKNRPITCRSISTSRPIRRESWLAVQAGTRPCNLIPTALQPGFEIGKRERPLVVGRLLERRSVQIGHPFFLRRGIAREREIHQAARDLARQRLAIEQRGAQQGLSLVLAFVGRQLEPACGLPDVLRAALPLDQHAAELVLGVGVAEIGCRIGEQIARARRAGGHRRVRNAADIISAERHEGVGDETRLPRAQAVVRMAVDDAAEILESPHIVATDLIAVGIHAAELPLSHRVAVLGGEFERPQPGLGVASPQRLGARTEGLDRRQSVL